MMKAVAAILILCLAAGSQAKRSALQLPTYTGADVNIEGASGATQQATPSTGSSNADTTQQVLATQATPTATATQAAAVATPVPTLSGVLAPAPGVAVSAPPTPVTLPPSQSPVQPPTLPPTQPPTLPPVQPPVKQPPVPAPVNPVLPFVAPVPAPFTRPLPPTPAPVTPLLPPTPAPQPPIQVPAPAPAVVLPLPRVPVPAPAPVPAPVPGPSNQPPQCGQQPQCRLFVEDMLCCDNAGALTNKQHAVMRLQCTHPVNYYPKCFNFTGPSNMTTFNMFNNDVWSSTHVAQMNILGGYTGNVTIDIESARTGNMSTDCGLYITPCLYNNNLVTTVAPVNSLSFSTIPTDDFIEVAENIQVDLDDLDNLVFPNMYYPQSCQQQNVGSLNSTFYSRDWVNYTMGTTFQCNYTAFVEALAPTPVMAAVAQAVIPNAVSG